MPDVEWSQHHPTIRSVRFAAAALAVFVGLAVSPGHGLALADSTTGGASTDTSQADTPANTRDVSTDSSAPRPVEERDSDDAGHTDRNTTGTNTTGTNTTGTDTTDTAASDLQSDLDLELDGAGLDGEPGNAVAEDDVLVVTEAEQTDTAEETGLEPSVAVPGDIPEAETDSNATDPATTDTDATDPATTDTQTGSPSADPVPSPPSGTETDSTPADAVVPQQADAPTVQPAIGVEDAAHPGEQAETPAAPTARQKLAIPAPVTADAPAASALVAVADSDAAVTIAPPTPQPLSPLAKLLQLPGRFINAILQVFDITTSANSPRSPISLAPINDFLFAAFREFERLLGLHQPPPVQPPVPTMTYDGPTTAATPTVTQFLNASAAGYGLGTTPGDLVPFTVNGFQLTSMNIFSGMAARAWVTPDQQVIVAYQGTTGGTHLLFNPFIAVSQIMTDLQMALTSSTPWAFHDAVRFARRVQTAAAQQGYLPEDIFVTGHSLGGWEAQYVAQQLGLNGIGFETPGINTAVPGNGADSMFVNIETYGDFVGMMSSDLPGLEPIAPPYVPGGGSKPHYGPIVMVGDPAAMTPVLNAAALWGKGLFGSLIALADVLINFLQYHLPGVQAYHLDSVPDPGVVPWLGTARGPVNTGYGALTIPQLMKAASDAGTLIRP